MDSRINISSFGFLLIVTTFSLPILSQTRMTNRVFDGLKGKVKSVKTYDSDLEAKNGKTVQGERTLGFSEEYDETGKTVETALYVIGSKNVFKVIEATKPRSTNAFKFREIGAVYLLVLQRRLKNRYLATHGSIPDVNYDMTRKAESLKREGTGMTVCSIHAGLTSSTTRIN